MRPIIGIVSYNTREQLRGCLTALRHHAAGFARIVVVDNASDDGSSEMVEREFPEVLLLSQSQNRGFGGGCNVAISLAAGGDVLLLNPDVEILPGAMESMLEFLNRTPDAAAISPLLVGRDGAPHTHLYRRFPSISQVILFWTVLRPICNRIPRLRRRYFEHDLRGSAPVPVDQLPGGAILIRASALRDVGLFDPDYFLWFEDVDWCYRARQAGHELYVLPAVTALHEGGASFGSWTVEKRVFQFYRAFFRFLCKHGFVHLRRVALPLLTADLLLKQGLLAMAARFLHGAADRAPSLAEARRTMREVVARHAAGELVSFSSADMTDQAPDRPERPHALPPHRELTETLTGTHSRTDVIIVNWNGRRYLPACLAALKRSSVPTRIVVVDNASSDDSVAYLRTEHADVEVLALVQNFGYAAGANAGLRATAGEYAIVMNADVSLSPSHLELLEARLDSDPGIGAAQGKLYQITADDFVAQRFDRTDRLDSAGHVIRRSRMVIDRGQGRPDGAEFSHEASIFSACGAALFLRRAMLEDIAIAGEYFGEAFFVYKEDIDIGWRARLMGWDVRYVPDAIAHHVRSLPLDGGAWRSMPLAARRHSWKNHYLLMIQNDRLGNIVRSLPFVAAWEAARLGHAVLRDPRVLLAYVDLARAIRPALRTRREIQRRRRVTARDMRRWFGAQPKPVPTLVESDRTAGVAL